MESGYNTGDEWVHDEIFHEINFEEFAGNYYSELDSDFSENEEEPMDQGEALPAHGMQNIQNDMGEDELQFHMEIDQDPMLNEAMGEVPNIVPEIPENVPHLPHSIFRENLQTPPPNIFHADRDDSPVSLQALLDFPEYFPNEDFLERRLEMERVRIVEPGRAPTPNNLFFKNEKIPEELRWDEFEENIQGILNPDLADKMKELRNRFCETVDIKEAINLFAEIKISEKREKVESEKRQMAQELNNSERKAEKHFSDYREAVLEKEAALNAARQMRTELVVQAQELCIERVRASNMTCIIQAWTKLCTDKEEELVWLRNEVTRQVHEIRELRDELLQAKHKLRIKE